MGLFQSIKDAHLRVFLEDEYGVKILKKYGAFLVLKDGVIVAFCYTIQAVREFLEKNQDFQKLLTEKGLPEKELKKWKNKQFKDEDDSFEEARVEEPSSEEIDELLKEEEKEEVDE